MASLIRCTLGSTLYFFISDELVRRMTWKLAHSNPTGFSFDLPDRGGQPFAREHPSGWFHTNGFLRHSAIASSSPWENAASRSERCVFGVSSRPRYRRLVVKARISPGRIPAMIANRAILAAGVPISLTKSASKLNHVPRKHTRLLVCFPVL